MHSCRCNRAQHFHLTPLHTPHTSSSTLPYPTTVRSDFLEVAPIELLHAQLSMQQQPAPCTAVTATDGGGTVLVASAAGAVYEVHIRDDPRLGVSPPGAGGSTQGRWTGEEVEGGAGEPAAALGGGVAAVRQVADMPGSWITQIRASAGAATVGTRGGDVVAFSQALGSVGAGVGGSVEPAGAAPGVWQRRQELAVDGCVTSLWCEPSMNEAVVATSR